MDLLIKRDMGWIEELSSWDATWLACEWALSDQQASRLAIANALTRDFPLVGDALVLEYLLADDDPQVREAAIAAAAVRKLPAF
jgi:hypothetical protein